MRVYLSWREVRRRTEIKRPYVKLVVVVRLDPTDERWDLCRIDTAGTIIGRTTCRFRLRCIYRVHLGEKRLPSADSNSRSTQHSPAVASKPGDPGLQCSEVAIDLAPLSSLLCDQFSIAAIEDEGLRSAVLGSLDTTAGVPWYLHMTILR